MTSVIKLDTRTEVETPENVTLTFQLAGPGSRMGAYLIDLVVRIVIAWLIAFVIGLLIPLLGVGAPTGLFLICLFMLEWWYSALFEGLRHGQTPGKQICGLRVIKDAGYPISFYDAVLRNFLRTADILPFGYGVGLICMSSTSRLQRVGDLVAGTMVVKIQEHRYERNAADFESLEPLQAAECSEKFSVSERTLDVIEQLLWRRGGLSRRRVEELAGVLAEPIACRLGYDLDSARSGQSPNVFFLRRVLRTFTSTSEGRAS